MARGRSLLVLGLVALWVATPALACLPNSHMTAVEMVCCKKMAGNCHMGVGQHPCCKTVSNAPQPVALVHSVSRIQPPVAVAAEIAVVVVPSIAQTDAMQVGLSLPPPSPPGQHAILRI